MLRILTALYRRADRAELDLIAAGVAFYGFLAIFPALAAVIALWGFASDPVVIRAQIAPLQQFLPADAYSLVSAQVEGLLTANNRHLGWSSALSLLLAVWSARAGMAALIRGLNAIHHVPNRAGVHHQLQAIIMTLILLALVLAAMLAAVVGPLIIIWLPLGPGEALTLELANMVLGSALLILAIGLIYRLGPNRKDAPRLFTRGLFLALVLWVLVSRGLALYLTNFAAYNQIYGSIGAVVALLMWFYLSAYAVLLGAAVDAERAARRRKVQ